MIEFYGEPSEESKMSIHKTNDKMMVFFYLVLGLVFLIIAIIGLILKDDAFKTLGFIGVAVAIVVVIAVKFIRPAKSVLKLGSIDKFIFDNESVTFIQKYGWSEVEKVRPISKVKKVIDAGEWYYIIFKTIVDNYWVCQKNLIVNGSLEEFEQLFKGKIQKNKNPK